MRCISPPLRISLLMVDNRYITHKDGSPLIEAVRLWREGALRSKTTQLSSRPTSPSPPPIHDRTRRVSSVDFGQQPTPSEERPRRPSISGEVPADARTTASVKKPSSSSWVRWWSRSRRDSREAEPSRPGLRPMDSAPSTIVSSFSWARTYPVGSCFLLSPRSRSLTTYSNRFYRPSHLNRNPFYLLR